MGGGTAGKGLDARLKKFRQEQKDHIKVKPTQEADVINSDDDDIGEEVRVVWNSSTHLKPKSEESQDEMPKDVQELRSRGNDAMHKGQPQHAVLFYSSALHHLQNQLQDDSDKRRPMQATLFSNRAAAHLELKDHISALSDAENASQLRPTWAKPFYKMAQAYLAQGLYQRAIQTARHGEQLSKSENGISCQRFTPLLDRIAMVAALNGSLAGFDGKLLQVRSAGEDAWLGREAPHNPLLDGPKANGDKFFPEVVKEVPVVHELTGASNTADSQLATTQRVYFRHLSEAMEAAEDGDRILLLRGTHNGCGRSIDVTKRVLISGEGNLEDATIDFRGNSPVFRIERCCMLQNLFVDMSGYTNAIGISGPQSIQPIIENCKITCTGDDAINVFGKSAPIIRDTLLTGEKKCGLRVWDTAQPALINCRLQKCGQQGVKAFDSSRPSLHNCELSECGAEGVVGLGDCRVHLEDCLIARNHGPGVDMSSSASAKIISCKIISNVGGLWGWNNANCVVSGSTIEGGSSLALLMDGDAVLDCSDVEVCGGVHATDLAWEGLATSANAIRTCKGQGDLPPPVVPFVYVPSEFSRGL